jgi:hypothetical protein
LGYFSSWVAANGQAEFHEYEDEYGGPANSLLAMYLPLPGAYKSTQGSIY